MLRALLKWMSAVSQIILSSLFQNYHSWISEDDIYKPQLEEVSDQEEGPASAAAAEVNVSQLPPSVVHRRQIGTPYLLSSYEKSQRELSHLKQ